MSIATSRAAIIDAAQKSLMLRDVQKQLIKDFERGERDIRITQLNFESMAVIEFCIVLEEQFGYAIAARTFYEYSTLGELAEVLDASVTS